MRYTLIIFLLFVMSLSYGQQTIPYCTNPKFEETIESYLDKTVQTIGVEELYETKDDYIILDIREKEEYLVSHIPGAIYLGYDDPDYSILERLDSDERIVVYCSIGVRSEKIGEKLQEKGFTDVKNLYGSIFEWANRSYPLECKSGDVTNEVHTYNKMWSKWVDNESIKKIH